MEDQTELTRKLLLLFVPVLALFGFAAAVVRLVFSVGAAGALAAVGEGFTVAAYIVAFVYALFGYKKPHGNLLRYTFLSFAVSLAVYAGTQSGAGDLSVFLNVLCTVPVAYTAGRLHKYRQNKLLLYLVAVMLLIAAVIDCRALAASLPEGGDGFYGFALKFGAFSKFILGVALAAAYFSRWHTHREAGMRDDTHQQTCAADTGRDKGEKR